ncbi:hypothetical protein FRC08_002458 [Ceratobasidium sp. 394]|nr:hypothetical protein FRC08_002458 [Ceratobasidium sp. 394]
MWWSATGLNAGKHTVTIKHVGFSGDYANLDFFMYIPRYPPPSLPPYRILTRRSDPTEEPSKTVPIGAIVGAVVGGVVVLVGLIVLAVFIYRRKRSAKEPEPAPESAKAAGVHNVVLPYKGSQETLSTLDEKVPEEKAVV